MAEVELENKTAEELKQMANEPPAGEEPPAETAALERLRYETSTGAVFEGATPDEIIEKMKKSIESGSTTIKQQNDELKRLRTAVAGEPAQEQKQPTFDNKAYYEQWAENPTEANLKALAHSLGYANMEEFTSTLKSLPQALTAVREMQQAQELFRFHSIVGETYPGGEDTAEKIGARLSDWGIDIERATGKQMADAYRVLVNEGAVKPLDAPAESASAAKKPPASISKVPSAAAVSEEFDESKLMSMPKEELDAFLRKQGVKKW